MSDVSLPASIDRLTCDLAYITMMTKMDTATAEDCNSRWFVASEAVVSTIPASKRLSQANLLLGSAL